MQESVVDGLLSPQKGCQLDGRLQPWPEQWQYFRLRKKELARIYSHLACWSICLDHPRPIDHCQGQVGDHHFALWGLGSTRCLQAEDCRVISHNDSCIYYHLLSQVRAGNVGEPSHLDSPGVTFRGGWNPTDFSTLTFDVSVECSSRSETPFLTILIVGRYASQRNNNTLESKATLPGAGEWIFVDWLAINHISIPIWALPCRTLLVAHTFFVAPVFPVVRARAGASTAVKNLRMPNNVQSPTSIETELWSFRTVIIDLVVDRENCGAQKRGDGGWREAHIGTR